MSDSRRGTADDAHNPWLAELSAAAAKLSAAGVDDPLRDARLLLAHVLGLTMAGLIVHETEPAAASQRDAFRGLIDRRLAREPVSRILGRRGFYGLEFEISPDVLDPRPETELLVEEGLRRLPPDGRVLDVGTGSGCILLSVLANAPSASGMGADISEAALSVARRNAARLGVASRALFARADWLRGVGRARFDVILSNPPYIRSDELPTLDPEVRLFDPKLALDGGEDGLTPYRTLATSARGLVAGGGSIGLETGAGQAREVARMLEENGFIAIDIRRDLGGVERAVFAINPDVEEQGGAPPRKKPPDRRGF